MFLFLQIFPFNVGSAGGGQVLARLWRVGRSMFIFSAPTSQKLHSIYAGDLLLLFGVGNANGGRRGGTADGAGQNEDGEHIGP